MTAKFELGSVSASELLLKELYIDLRRSLLNWASVTLQTPQARMGYVGQHLTSVVTGIPGGRSGARGNDLFDPKTKLFYEIKTCTRVDQLGECSVCHESVASIESVCPSCASKSITRRDDSKWLITPQTENDMKTLFEPEAYFLVLFDFVDLVSAEDINARIYAIDPKDLGFSLCMVDYWLNIRSKSKSKAPFNLWPFSFKYELMRPKLIYHAIIGSDDSIETKIFPGRDNSVKIGMSPFYSHARARTFTKEIIEDLCKVSGLKMNGSIIETAIMLDEWRKNQNVDDDILIDMLCHRVYWDNVSKGISYLPVTVANQMNKFQPNF